MNAAVAIAAAVVMRACCIGDPVLWGVVAFLSNHVPIMGPLVSAALFFCAGLLVSPTLWKSLLPAGLYLLIHVLEGETITPMLLARRFTLNPVLAIISLIFWFRMRGRFRRRPVNADARHHENYLRWREASKRCRSFPRRGRT
jgi:predicted PurR-regulated permease PerM